MSFPTIPLIKLEPQFMKLTVNGSRMRDVSFLDSDGIIFVCPKCMHRKGQRPGVHSIICWQLHVPKDVSPGPGRWLFKGSSFEDLSLVAGSSSIFLTGQGCGAHFYIENGQVRDAE